jgi:hypothetical protein
MDCPEALAAPPPGEAEGGDQVDDPVGAGHLVEETLNDCGIIEAAILHPSSPIAKA